MAVTEGMDYERCIGIADELKRLGERLGDLATEGGAMTETLADSWGGDDCDRFVFDWHFSAKPALVDGGGDITAYAQKLRTQAVEQDLASELDGPMSATSTAKSGWDRFKDGTVDKMRGAAKFMNDAVDKYPILYLVPGGGGLAWKLGADQLNTAADWVDDPKQAAEDWKNKPRWEQGLDVVSVLPVGRPIGAAGRVIKGAVKTEKTVNRTTDVAKHRPDGPKKGPDRDVENEAAADGAPPKAPDDGPETPNRSDTADDSGKADEGASDAAKNTDDRTPEEIREHGGGAREMADPPPNNFPSDAKVQKKYDAHAEDFGVEGNYNKANGEKFRQAVDGHVSDPGTRHIDGYYRGKPAILDYNPETGLVTARQPNGDFISGWKAAPDQVRNIEERGSLQ
ncbi:hypothetical protein DUHN55_32110 [Helicobacter pylori]